MFKDYYKILEVSRNATADDIKISYRKLAKKYHPDSNSGVNDFTEIMQDINEAYDILKSEEKRNNYNLIYDIQFAGQKAREEAEKRERERQAREEAEKREREQKAREEAEKRERERQAREEAEKREREQKAREEAEKRERERQAREEAEKRERERQAREEAEKREREQQVKNGLYIWTGTVKTEAINGEKFPDFRERMVDNLPKAQLSKNEFETTAEYNLRVKQEEIKFQERLQIAELNFLNRYFGFQNVEMTYNADNEIFDVTINKHLTFKIKVPREIAQNFKIATKNFIIVFDKNKNIVSISTQFRGTKYFGELFNEDFYHRVETELIKSLLYGTIFIILIIIKISLS